MLDADGINSSSIFQNKISSNQPRKRKNKRVDLRKADLTGILEIWCSVRVDAPAISHQIKFKATLLVHVAIKLQLCAPTKKVHKLVMPISCVVFTSHPQKNEEEKRIIPELPLLTPCSLEEKEEENYIIPELA